MIINPQKIIDRKVVELSLYSKIAQNGIDLTVSEDVFLNKGESKNILLNEKISLPANVCAELKVRSTYSRKGLFLSSGLWDSGFVGNLGCTLYNMSNDSILIPKNERVCQVVCYEAESASLYNGKWQNQ